MSDQSFKTFSYSGLSPANRLVVVAKSQDLMKQIGKDRVIVQTQLPYCRPGHGRHLLYSNRPPLEELGVTYDSFEISGMAKGDVYLIDNNDACIVIPGHKQLAEGERLSGYVTRVGVLEYTTILGAGRRIPKYEYIFSKELTQADIEGYLDDGNVIFLPHFKNVRCVKCMGIGHTTVRKDVREGRKVLKNKIVTETCKTCNGGKTVVFPSINVIKK